MKLPGIRRSSSLWCISVLHKLFVEVFCKFIQFRCNSVDTKTKTLKLFRLLQCENKRFYLTEIIMLMQGMSS